MRSVRIETAYQSVERNPGPDPSGQPRAGQQQARVWRRLAAFLLGLTLGVSGIIIGQSAFHADPDLFGPSDAPPALRR